MKIKSFFKTKYIVWGIIIILAVTAIWFLFFKNDDNQKTPFVVHSGEFVNQVSVSGRIKASQDVNLSFEQPGIVRGVYTKVGDTVYAGKLIASQDTANLYAQASQMQAGIDLEKAKLNQLLAGSSKEDIKIKEDAVLSAKQDLQSAYDSSLVSLQSSYNAIYNAYTLVAYLATTYFSAIDTEGINVQTAKLGISVSLADAKNYLDQAKSNQDAVSVAITNMSIDLNATYDNLKIIREQADLGIYYTRVLATDKTSLDTQRSSINTALTTVASSKQSVVSYKALLVQAQNQFEAIKAVPRSTDTAVYDAQIAQADAQLKQVYAQIRNKQIIAPITGTITVVNAKVGSIAGSGEVAVSLIGNGKFQIESFVPEIYISSVRIGNEAEITLDAFGPDKKLGATVVFIDPSQTQKDGVSTYKTTLQFVGQAEVKDGMSANVVIITNKKQNVISVPQGLVIVKDGKKFVKVTQGENVIEKEVQTGDISSSGQVEIVSGLNEGDILPLN